MILTDQDAKTLENNTKFKSVELNENFVNVDQNGDTQEQASNSGLHSMDESRPASPEDL